MKLAGRTAIVTGASQGIGFAVAEKLVAEGCSVVIADIHDAALAAARLEGRAGAAIGLPLDVTSEDQVASAVAETVARFGSVDILVNNAAIASELVPGPFEESTPAQWRRILDVNVVGTFLMCRAVAPHMRARKWGRIVNVGSGTAFKGLPGLAHYVASKGAIIMLTRTLANELGGDNVLVNVVSPGFTMTEAVRGNSEIRDAFGPRAIATRAIKREAQSIDVANVIYFFVSEEASFVTGQNLAADGGSVFH